MRVDLVDIKDVINRASNISQSGKRVLPTTEDLQVRKGTIIAQQETLMSGSLRSLLTTTQQEPKLKRTYNQSSSGYSSETLSFPLSSVSADMEDIYSSSDPDNKPLPHLWLKKPPHSRLQYKVISAEEISCYLFRVVLEVEVRNGFVLGTETQFEKLLSNPTSSFKSAHQDNFLFRSRKQCLNFEKVDGHGEFDVCVTEVSTRKRKSKIYLRNMNESLWSHLEQVISASKRFHECMNVEHNLPTDFVDRQATSNNAVLKRIELSVSMSHYLNFMTAGIECLELFRSLPVIDQVILLKSGTVTTMLIFSIVLQDKQNYTEVFSAFDNNLLFAIDLNSMKNEPSIQEAYPLYMHLLHEMFDFLQEDALAISLITIIFFLQEHSGLTEGTRVTQERFMFVRLLEKYIEGKVNAGDWTFSVEEILSNIDSLTPLIPKLNECYVRYAAFVERRLMRQLQTQNFSSVSSLTEYSYSCMNPDDRPLPHLLLKKPPHSHLVYEIISAEEIPHYLSRIVVEVQVKDGVIVGTDRKYDELISKRRPKTLFVNGDGSIFFISRKQSLKIEKIPTENEEFLASITDFFYSKRTLHLSGMNNNLWDHLEQILFASKHFHNSGDVEHIPVSHATKNGTEVRRIELLLSMNQYLKCMSSGIESLGVFKALSSADQVTLLKSGILKISCLFGILLQDRKNNVEVYSAFDNNLLLGMDWNIMQIEPLAAKGQELHQQILKQMFDFLQEDALFVCFLCIVLFFQDISGITGVEKANQARSTFAELLEKYIHAKIRQSHWVTSFEDIQSNIDSIVPLLNEISDVYLYFSAEIERRLVEVPLSSSGTSCKSSGADSSVQKEGFYIKRTSHSTLTFEIIQTHYIPGYIFQALIEVPVDNGMIVGTDCVFEDLLRNENSNLPSYDEEKKEVILRWPTSVNQEIRLWQRCSPHYQTNGEIVMTNTCSSDVIILKAMKDQHFDRIRQMATAWVRFMDCYDVTYYLPQEDKITPNHESWRRILITCHHDDCANPISTGIETLDCVRKLSLEDQIIVLKESFCNVSFLLSMLCISKEENCFFMTGFKNQLKFCLDLECLKKHEIAREVEKIYCHLFDRLQDWLLKDIFFLNILNALFIFKDRAGLTSTEPIKNERQLYADILNSYIDAMITSDKWPDTVREDIEELIDITSEMNGNFVRFARDMDAYITSHGLRMS
jgi:hypothetical protein